MLVRISKVVLILVVLTGSVAGIGILWHYDLATIQAGVESLGDLRTSLPATLAFIGVYAILLTLLVPATFMTLIGGFIYGPALGLLINLSGATLGAMLALLNARYIAGQRIRRHILGGHSEALKLLLSSVEQEGWRAVALSRLVPGMPFFLVNYALGISKIRLLPYIVATFLFTAPGIGAFTYLGHIGSESLFASDDQTPLIIQGIAVVIALLLLPHLVKTIRQNRSENASRSEIR